MVYPNGALVCPVGMGMSWGCYHVIYPMMHVMLSIPLPGTERQTGACENITFSQLHLWAVINEWP